MEIQMRLDSKVHGTLVSNKNGVEIPEDEFIVFRAHDNALISTLTHYRHQLETLGAKQNQLLAVDDLISRVQYWRAGHPERCKVPDVEPGELKI
jgi:hypothetical protein